MHSVIKKTLLVPGLVLALAASSAACGGNGDGGGAATGPDGTAASRSPSSRGLGNIVVGGKAVTGSEPSGVDKVPYRRTSTDGALYAPVTGYRSMMYGRNGLEAVYDDVLTAGVKSGGASGNVVTTIDPKAQKAAFDALGDRRGAAVALDARTGRLLALVSTPSYDPATFSGATPDDATAWKALTADERDPLLNRALRLAPGPGATFHVVVAAAALEHGLYASVDDSTRTPLNYVVPGTDAAVAGDSPRCENASIRTALRYSCDNVFARLAVDAGQSALRSTAEKLGYNQELTIPLRATESTYPTKPLTAAQLARTGTGGGGVVATPLETARITAALADGGRLVTPRLVERVEKADGSTQRQADSGGSGRAVSRRTAEQLRSALPAVASRDGDRRGSWFTTYARQGDGRLVSVAVHVSGGDGGQEAGRIAGKILAALA
ncbi:penicillin-binding transpeptidase domain-containing protein [Streptomyces tricolor]